MLGAIPYLHRFCYIVPQCHSRLFTSEKTEAQNENSDLLRVPQDLGPIPSPGLFGPQHTAFPEASISLFLFLYKSQRPPGQCYQSRSRRNTLSAMSRRAGIWKCFGEEMEKKLTLENSPCGSKLQSGRPGEKGRWQGQLGFVFGQLWVSVALPMLAPGPPPQEGWGLP